MSRRLPAILCFLAVSAAACGGGKATTTSSSAQAPLTLRWSFLRHVVAAGATGADVAYDASPNPDSAAGPCPQSGAERIAVADAATGQPLDPTHPSYPCVQGGGVQGVTFPALEPGSYDLLVTGFEGDVATYQARETFDVAAGSANMHDVVLPGVQDDLDIAVQFWDAAGANFISDSCNHAQVQAESLRVTLHDRSGTLVASSTVPCPVTGLPLIRLRQELGAPLDRGSYTVRIRAFVGTLTLKFDSLTTRATPDCRGAAFQHAGPDVFGGSPWTLKTYLVLDDLSLCPL